MQKYHRLIVFGLLLALAAFVALTLIADINNFSKDGPTLMQAAVQFPWWILVAALGLRVVNWILRFFKWHFYLHLVGVKNITYRDSATIFAMGFPLAVSPGKSAEVIKSFVIKNLYGAPVASTLPVVAAERLSDGIAVVLLVAWSLLNLPSASQYWALTAISLAGFFALIIIFQFRALALALLDQLSKFPLIGKVAHHFEMFYESSYKIVLLPNLIRAVGLGLIANTLDGVGVYLILVGVGLPPTIETFFQALLVISLSVIAGAASGMPGGVGAAEFAIFGTLRAVLNLDVAQAGFVTLLARFVQLWWGVIIGSIVVFLARKRLFTPSLERIIEAERQTNAMTIEAASGHSDLSEPVTRRAQQG